MVPGIFVREAGQSDVSTLIEYNLSLANETESILLDKDILRLGIEKALELNDCRYLVAELNNKIVGQTMVTSEWSDWRNGVIWWMQSVYVNPDYRKRGVFQSILKHIENLAEKIPEVKALRLYVMDDNQIAQRVYQNLGMNNSNYLVYGNELKVYFPMEKRYLFNMYNKLVKEKQKEKFWSRNDILDITKIEYVSIHKDKYPENFKFNKNAIDQNLFGTPLIEKKFRFTIN